jgi:hypothetical protein
MNILAINYIINYALTSNMLEFVLARITNFLLGQFHKRWNASQRTKGRFFRNNSDWCNSDFIVNFSEKEFEITIPQNTGRPVLKFE